MAMTRRTFGQLITSAAIAAALPFKTAIAEVKSKLNLTQSGSYAIIALNDATYQGIRPVWPRISASVTWELIRQHGVFDAKQNVWWVKLAVIPDAVCSNQVWVDRPAGGPATGYAASFIALCDSGEVYDVQKNVGIEENIPPQLHTHATKILRPRLIAFLGDKPPHIEVIV